MEKYFKMKINAHNKTPKVDQSIDIGKKIKAFLIDVISHLFFSQNMCCMHLVLQ